MTNHLPKPVPLDLTEFPAGVPCVSIDEQTIRRVVDAFYGTVCEDEILGPIFQSAIKDWSSHLLTLHDFWSAVVLRTCRYSGRPIEAHAGLGGLERSHFARWMALWEATIEREVPAESRQAFLAPARRMADSMAMKFCQR